MAASGKPTPRIGMHKPVMTPLMQRNIAKKPAPVKSLFSSTLPNARSSGLTPLAKDVKPIISIPKRNEKPSSRQLLSRKISLPTHLPSETKLPQLRTRTDSDSALISKPTLPTHSLFSPFPSPKPSILRCFCASQVGTVLGRPKPNNQDSQFYVNSTIPGAEYAVMGVCDGHGMAGHFVSGYIAKTLPARVKEDYLHKVGRSGDLWASVLHDSFQRCNIDLKHQSFDTVCSGSTCVVVVLANSSLLCANVGDSRAVLARKTPTGSIALPLSKDHKPDVPEERQRIIECDGRVEPVFGNSGEPVGPPRVWMQTEDVPGLAMTRAFGDFLATKIGVIATPGEGHIELLATTLTGEDSFLILASDGVWEFISSQEAVDMVEDCIKTGRTDSCCQVLIEESTKRWNKEEDCVDDITVLVALLGTK